MFFNIDMVSLFLICWFSQMITRFAFVVFFLYWDRKNCILVVRMAAIQTLDFLNDYLLQIKVALRSEKCLGKSSGRCMSETLVYQKSRTPGGLSSCLHKSFFFFLVK